MLWLLRHADAADGEPDDARPLTEKGMRHAQAAGHALAQMGVKLDACLTSPKLRAMQTAELTCEPLGVPITIEPRLAGGPFEPEELVAGLPDALLVGHDPSMSLALHDLTGVHSRMSKGGLAAINKGELIVLLRPKELTLMAGTREPVA
ncbi:MAG TPA: phosphoglycerate mutase family protein [Solirubrobacteraceae bacterium]|jgi:phosphohistidine phosphatase|nr:phosphoglycerate mutase family protein [Solirubrobacteraceae bacterium]